MNIMRVLISIVVMIACCVYVAFRNRFETHLYRLGLWSEPELRTECLRLEALCKGNDVAMASAIDIELALTKYLSTSDMLELSERSRDIEVSMQKVSFALPYDYAIQHRLQKVFDMMKRCMQLHAFQLRYLNGEHQAFIPPPDYGPLSFEATCHNFLSF